jgi:hypothetical protein
VATLMRSELTSGHPRPAPAAATGPIAGALAQLSFLPVWVTTAVVYVGFAAVFFASGARFAIPYVQLLCGQSPPDMRFTSTAAEVHGFLGACGPEGRWAYGAMEVADLFYPLVFAAFLGSSLAVALRLLAPARRGLAALASVPFVASAFDYLENACAWLALAAWPQPGAADGLLGLFSAGKTAASWVAGTLLLFALGALVVRCVRALPARRRRRVVGAGRR